MHEIIDSPYPLGDHAARLSQEGVRTVIRYYNNKNSSTFPSKCLTPAEYGKLTAAGLNVAVVFQQRGGAGGFLEDFGAGKGARDANRAMALAGTIGQAAGSAIYFGVDHDFFRGSELDQIDRYFAEVNAALGGRFRVGVYGSGAVCSRLKSTGHASLFWLPASMGWSGSKAFLASQQWTLFQKFQELQSTFGRFDYDGNIFNPAFEDFGQFGAPALASPSERLRSEGVAVFEVIARSGLRLRGGAGEGFAVLQTLPLGTVVHGLGQEGDWVQVDVGGDGVADGFMARAFLKALAGGLPLSPTPPSAPAIPRAYAIAQAELTLDVREVTGPQNNSRIVLYHSSTSGGAAPDETAWCSSFVNYCVEQAGLKGTDSKWARSWHDGGWGEAVTDDPRPGDIVVWRRQSASGDGGHVGFFVEKIGSDTIRVLGGNQSNRVRISDYPVKGTLAGMKYTLLSIRR
ncbi:TIGR02594 family protein [Sphingobium terrigena]|uniref:TIGR02594 family protein n=1 Tax=Sphingobium terrigena TaxID=2304063 RepID=A0A418YMV3_9SPHN|nr:TIGR02594 family protein [Sphingobium terrigena]RJG52497.1 TIGR02594 family protein [Sphingobium terrigena]